MRKTTNLVPKCMNLLPEAMSTVQLYGWYVQNGNKYISLYDGYQYVDFDTS